MTSKQRAMLRSMANTMETILYVGKEGVTPGTVKEAYDALEARELIKGAVQPGAPVTAKEAMEELCRQTGAEPVQQIGRRFVLYRPSRENPRFVLEYSHRKNKNRPPGKYRVGENIGRLPPLYASGSSRPRVPSLRR